MSPEILPSFSADLEHDGRSYQIALSDFPALQCACCGNIMLDDAANRTLSDALRAQVGLLAPGDIRRNRELLRLTQKELASCLRIAESELSRWETGVQIQQRCMDTMLRAFFGS